MLHSLDDLLAVVAQLYPVDPPRHFEVLAAAKRVRDGEDATVVGRPLRIRPDRLRRLVEATDAVEELLGCSLAAAAADEPMRKGRTIVGQLLLGQLAERSFEHIYKTTMGTNELILVDDRSARGDTDYKVLNGNRRPVFRINIKFHGTLFRDAKAQVGLEPEDCFALATYKIHQALLKQEKEVLPYLFVIVSVPGITGGTVGAAAPEDLVHLVSLLHTTRVIPKKRSIEERVVEHLINDEKTEPFRSQLAGFVDEISSAKWRVVSARKADSLLRTLLFDRVFAVRVRGFAQKYRRAELDMHFSLANDLTPLQEFLALLKEHGLHGLTARLERGLV